MIQKKIEIIHTFLQKGDYVRTWNGVGIVVEDEEEYNDFRDIIDSEIKVQLKSGHSSNTGNKVEGHLRTDLIIINKEEYDKET